MLIAIAALFVASGSPLRAQEAEFAADPSSGFVAETLGAIEIGYGVALGDVNGDGAPDVLLADRRQFVWYRNPDWRRFVMAENLTPRDNVCIAARDIDGDGRVEVAVGANWNPGDTHESGSVHYLIPPKDRTRPWMPIALEHEPTVHRMRWVRVTADRFDLVVSPLHGRGNVNAQGAGARLLAYQRPDDVREPWSTVLLDDALHLAHNFDRGQWNPDSVAEELLYIGREGALLLEFDQGRWNRQQLTGIEGGGEIRMGLSDGADPFVATISPFHGHQLSVYRSHPGDTRRTNGSTPLEGQESESGEEHARANTASHTSFSRTMLDETFKGGHAIAVADLIGDARLEIVAGWRLPNDEGLVGVKLFQESGEDRWTSRWIDRGGMATEDLRVADLDADGRPDIVAAGRASKNLKVYWNRVAE